MARRSPRQRRDRPSHSPLWLVEGLDIVHRRWVILVAVAAAVVVAGAVGAALFPGVMAPTAGVGAAVGVAALLLGLAAAIAADAADLVIRGPRHVGAAGGELVAVLPRDANVGAAGPLASAVLEVRRPGHPVLLALAAAGRDARRVTTWTDALARALVAEGASVLHVELGSGRSELPGLVEVIRDGRRLSDVVAFEPDIKLAHLTAGRDHQEALACVNELPARLPRDLDVLLVSLPSTVSRAVVAAAGVFDHLLIMAERDRTSRVDLIAGLEALTSVGTEAQVVLLDTLTVLRLAPPVPADQVAPGPRPRNPIASTVGMPAVLLPDEPPAPSADAAASPATSGENPVEPDVEVAPEPEPAAEDVSEPGPDVEVAPEPEPAPAAEDVSEPGPDVEVAPEPEPAARPPSGFGPRDVELVDAARIAAARGLVDAGNPEHRKPEASETGDGTDPVRVVAAGPQGTVLDDPDPRAGAALDPGSQAEEDCGEDDTDQLEPIGHQPLADPDDDSLRTTAQLAILTQHLEERQEDPGSDATESDPASDPEDR